MSKLRLEEEVAGVLSATRSNPRSLVPHLQELDAKFIGVSIARRLAVGVARALRALLASRKLQKTPCSDALAPPIGDPYRGAHCHTTSAVITISFGSLVQKNACLPKQILACETMSLGLGCCVSGT